MTKRNLKKLLALGMAAMMTVSTGVTTFAANTDDNLVVTGDTLYSTQIQSGKRLHWDCYRLTVAIQELDSILLQMQKKD